MAFTTNSNHTVLRGGGQGGHLYTGVEPIVVNNQEYKISANTAALGVESPLYFSVDTPTQTVISFSGDGQPYSAGENISVENHIISGKDWTPELDEKLDITALENLDVTEYSAGDNINISNHVISGKDWNPEINNASSYALSEAIVMLQEYPSGVDNITPDIVTSYISGSLLHISAKDWADDISDASAMATAWTDSQGYLTAEVEYSAGANIDITDHIISGKDWSDDITAASANALNEAVNNITAVELANSALSAQTAINANHAASSDSATYDSLGRKIVDTYLTAHQQLPDWTPTIQAASANAASVGSAAATAWTDQQNYLTAHQDVTDLPYVQNSALDYTPGAHLVSSISGDGLYAASAEGAFTAETANYSYVAETANYVADGWEYNASNEITGYSGSAFHAETPSEGKIYTGISPIVVDNSTTTGTISAQTARLGVQGPLYFVEDTSASTVIGISGLPEVEGVTYESALNFGGGYITGYNSSALSSERSRYAVSSTSANGAISSQTAAVVTGGWETANGKITGYNGTAFYTAAGNTYDVKASSNISVATAGTTFTVSGKDWTNTITAASSYAYNQATAGGQGRTYDGVYPIAVNNTENKISAYTIPLYAGNYLSMSTASTGVTLNVTGMNKTNWDVARNLVTSNSAFWNEGAYVIQQRSAQYDAALINNSKVYDSYNNPNWFANTANNYFGFKINSGAFKSTGFGINAATLHALNVSGNTWRLFVSICFNNLQPYITNEWNRVANDFITTTGHFNTPLTAAISDGWNSNFGCIESIDNFLWYQAIALNKWAPYSGYTANNQTVNFTVGWFNG